MSPAMSHGHAWIVVKAHLPSQIHLANPDVGALDRTLPASGLCLPISFPSKNVPSSRTVSELFATLPCPGVAIVCLDECAGFWIRWDRSLVFD